MSKKCKASNIRKLNESKMADCYNILFVGHKGVGKSSVLNQIFSHFETG
jgi:predicted GTPase